MARTADDVRRLPAGEGHRLPPHNMEAEASVLGAMLLSNEAVADVVEILEADDFYRSAHGRIYTALRGLFARGEPVDIVSAAVALERDGALDDIGGRIYLADLANEVPTPASAAYYADIVSKAALRRRLISAAADIMDRAYASTDDATEVADDA
jgi:replicative DNA helicase